MKAASIGKFLDQPILSNTLNRKMPIILCTAALAYGIKDTLSQPKEERKNRAIRNASILGSITTASLLGSKFIKIKGEKLIETIPKDTILKNQTKAVDEFVKENIINDGITKNILEKAKSKMLNLKDTDYLLNSTKGFKKRDELISTLFGNKGNITSGEIMQEISKLSTMGFIPVASGIAGGIAADKITGENSREKTTNKIKEGIYQFFANIFLCNVGAGTFLWTAEKLNKKGIIKELTPLKKTGVILAGIMTVGVLGGSCIANFIGNKCVNPVIDKFNKEKSCNTQKNKEKETRKPEPLDIALHTDDIATAGVLSGVKWIEPLLPVMYLVSGYRAGIGYRNGDNGDSGLTKKDSIDHN